VGGGCRGQRPRLALVQMLVGALQELVNPIFSLEELFCTFHCIVSVNNNENILIVKIFQFSS